MAEINRTCALNLHHHVTRQMAAGTVIQVKGLLPRMAGAARTTLFHTGHGHGRVSAGLEEAGVAAVAADFPGVWAMDEYDVAGRSDGEGHIPDLVAASAPGKGEGDPAVARTARLPLFHLRHGHGALALLTVKLLMAEGAIVVDCLCVEVDFMAEYGFPGVADVKDYIQHVRGINLGSYRHYGDQYYDCTNKLHGGS